MFGGGNEVGVCLQQDLAAGAAIGGQLASSRIEGGRSEPSRDVGIVRKTRVNAGDGGEDLILRAAGHRHHQGSERGLRPMSPLP